jgi:hypothetical protein
MKRVLGVGGVAITDRDRPEPEVCDWCEGLFDGSEREVWVAGVRIWAHRQCEKAYLAYLNKPGSALPEGGP